MHNPINPSDFEKIEILWEYVRIYNQVPPVETVYKNWQLGAWFDMVKRSKCLKYKNISKSKDEYVNMLIKKSFI